MELAGWIALRQSYPKPTAQQQPQLPVAWRHRQPRDASHQPGRADIRDRHLAPCHGLWQRPTPPWPARQLKPASNCATSAMRLRSFCGCSQDCMLVKASLNVSLTELAAYAALAPPAAEHHHRTHAGIHRVPQRAAAKAARCHTISCGRHQQPGQEQAVGRPCRAPQEHSARVQHAPPATILWKGLILAAPAAHGPADGTSRRISR
jgi:hypothetical protein